MASGCFPLWCVAPLDRVASKSPVPLLVSKLSSKNGEVLSLSGMVQRSYVGDGHSPHTHLLRNILSNYWSGMHHTCKNTSAKPDRRHWMIRSEKLCEVNQSMFRCSSVFCNWPKVVPDCDNSAEMTRKENCSTCRFWAWPVAIDENRKMVQVRRLASQSVSPDQMGVFVGSGPKWSAATPCLKLDIR